MNPEIPEESVHEEKIARESWEPKFTNLWRIRRNDGKNIID